jgi:hypothetical protein
MSSPLRWWQDPRIIETKKRGQSLSREKVTGGGEGCAAVASLFRLTSLPALPPLPACSASRRCQLCRQVQFVCTTSRRDSEPEMDTLSSPMPLLALPPSPARCAWRRWGCLDTLDYWRRNATIGENHAKRFDFFTLPPLGMCAGFYTVT